MANSQIDSLLQPTAPPRTAQTSRQGVDAEFVSLFERAVTADSDVSRDRPARLERERGQTAPDAKEPSTATNRHDRSAQDASADDPGEPIEDASDNSTDSSNVSTTLSSSSDDDGQSVQDDTTENADDEQTPNEGQEENGTSDEGNGAETSAEVQPTSQAKGTDAPTLNSDAIPVQSASDSHENGPNQPGGQPIDGLPTAGDSAGAEDGSAGAEDGDAGAEGGDGEQPSTAQSRPDTSGVNQDSSQTAAADQPAAALAVAEASAVETSSPSSTPPSDRQSVASAAAHSDDETSVNQSHGSGPNAAKQSSNNGESYRSDADSRSVDVNKPPALATPEGKQLLPNEQAETLLESEPPAAAAPNEGGASHEESPTERRALDRPSTTLERLQANRTAQPTSRTESSTELTTVDRARFVQRVSGAIQRAQLRDGQMRVRLSPPELGSLRIEIAVRQGALTASIEADTAQARTVLLDNMPALRDRLAEQDVRLERFEVDVRRDGQQQSADFGNRGESRDGRSRHSTTPGSREQTAESAGKTQDAASLPNSVLDTALDVRI